MAKCFDFLGEDRHGIEVISRLDVAETWINGMSSRLLAILAILMRSTYYDP